ncbi:Hint domain-containing protein [Profundibacter sp.]|uniref:Hint domain-containing protein n=1 Tax=Profundibacter sp. TaxID=3101071 RepID=UPI003D0C5274
MALYTVTAFKWSGTGYNATYNTSYSATLSDNDPAYQGGTDADETVSIDGGAFNSTASSPYAIDISFTDINGVAHVETFYFFNTGGSWYFIPGPGSAFTVGATLGSYQSHILGWNYSDVTCFVRGTRIRTANGELPVEDLRAGMMVETLDAGPQKLRLVLQREISATELAENPKLRPVLMPAGSLGNGLPLRDLRVSRQHRMLVSSPVVQRMFGQNGVLVSAIRLAALPGICVDMKTPQVEYFHLLFDDHQVVFAEGTPSESLYTGELALNALPQEAVEEIFEILPQVARLDYRCEPARIIPEDRRQKRLVERHVKNGRAPVS